MYDALLQSILEHGTGLPAGFMALRGASLQVTVNRHFNGSTDPIPVINYPGVFTDKGDTINLDLANIERNTAEGRVKKWKAYRERKRLRALAA